MLLALIAAVGAVHQLSFRSPSEFKALLNRLGYPTDKVVIGTDYGHSYEGMYWTHLTQMTARLHRPPRILEIGLGCFMRHGPGGSAKLWREIFPAGDIHVFEYQRTCGRAWEAENPGIATVHYGDQSNKTDLLAAVDSLLPFDLIIDDGSHVSAHQIVSLTTLWPYLAAGGAYIVEDIHGSCANWNVPGTQTHTGGTSSCLKDIEGNPTFFSHVVGEWLPVLVRSSEASPHALPRLESVAFHHEAAVFVKQMPTEN
jgi:hypothetical protein